MSVYLTTVSKQQLSQELEFAIFCDTITQTTIYGHSAKLMLQLYTTLTIQQPYHTRGKIRWVKLSWIQPSEVFADALP